MNKQFLRVTLSAIIITLIGSKLYPAVASPQPPTGNETHFCGVTHDRWNRRQADQFPNRRYARSLAANLNVGEPLTVRIIYFLPSDSPLQPNIDTKLDTLIKGAQHHYIEVMEGHGFGRKTFTFETDAHGKAVVHHIDGQFPDAYYIDNTTSKVLEEIEQQFDTSKNIYLIAINISNAGLDGRTACGTGYFNGTVGGFALIPSSGLCFNVSVTAHELGHAFGLTHDYRANAKVVPSPYTSDPMTTSFCAAEWLDAHRYFNTKREVQDSFDTTVEMLPPSLVSEPNTIRLRFKVTDHDGLHQVQLLLPEVSFSGGLIACKGLEGTSSTIEFVTTLLTPKRNQVSLHVMDVHGKFTLWSSSSIDVLALLPPPKAISIPDANLAAAVREALNLAPTSSLTTQTMLNLTFLELNNQGVTNLTGLEYAHNLKELWLGADLIDDKWVSSNAISDLSPIEGLKQLYWIQLANPSNAAVSALPRLTSLRALQIYNPPISDVSVIAELTQLRVLQILNPSVSNVSALVSAAAELIQLEVLEISGSSISDISPLVGLTQLERLALLDNAITDISPLAGLTQLKKLELDYNAISDISPLVGLTQLERLELLDNAITDISPVAGLTRLTRLYLANNSISDISPLRDLIDLRELHLENNSISDISPVSGLTRLTRLFLVNNSISDISPLRDLIDLTSLHLGYNSISDLSPLVANTGLGPGLGQGVVWAYGNPLSYQSIHTHIPALQSRGFTVEFDNRIPTTLLKISGVITASDNVLTVEVRDGNGRTFEGVPVAFAITSGGGTLSVTNATTDKKGRAQSRLTLGNESNRVTVSAVGTEQTVTFSEVAEAGVHIPDPNLRAAIEDALGVKSGSPISPEEMATLTYLKARDASIGVLIGLELATNLTELHLQNNSITDISPLSGLTNLRTLGLSNNGLTDVSALVSVLSGSTNLTELHLSYNRITNISSLSRLTHLTELRLSGNRITDIAPLLKLTKLRTLAFPSGITDVPPLIRVLSRLPHLTSIVLSDSNIADVSVLIPVLSDLTDLTGLDLPGNGITDLSPLAKLTNLTSLNLWNNSVSDISPLVENTGLGSQGWSWVGVRENPLSYQSIHTHIPILQNRGVTVDYDNQAYPAILKISGDNQTGLPGAVLANPFVIEVQDANGFALTGTSVVFTVVAGDGMLSETSATTGSNGRAQSTLTLGSNPGTNTVSVSVKEIQELQTFHAEGMRIPKRLEIISGNDQRGLPGEALDKPFVVEVRDQTDIPIPGVEVTFSVTAGGGTLSATTVTTDASGRAESTLTLGAIPGANTVSVSVEGHTEAVALLTIESARMSMYTLSIPAGTHAIHIPLKVNKINGADGMIETVGDLYNALGDAVGLIITVGDDGQWENYVGAISAGTAADAAIDDDTGLIAVMSDTATLELAGKALGAGGESVINIDIGNNLVGVPLKPEDDMMISDLLVEGVEAIVSGLNTIPANTITAAGDPGDGPLMGGVGYVVVSSAETSIPIEGSAWENESTEMAAPAVAFDGTQASVLYVEGGVVDEFGMLARIPVLRVTVKNLSTGASLDTVLGTEESTASYSGTFVEFSRRAAKAGDVLEIVAHSPSPYVGVRPVPQIVVSAEEVLTSRISLPDLELYEIPSETELLANYPNPFNPETWIPYRLAKAAKVTLEIYDTNGSLVRSIDVGFKPAAVYESRASAIYWDGRNNDGERVASGTYFYHLTAGDDYASTRRMVILK